LLNPHVIQCGVAVNIAAYSTRYSDYIHEFESGKDRREKKEKRKVCRKNPEEEKLQYVETNCGWCED